MRYSTPGAAPAFAQGFTLVELLVSMAIIAVISTMMVVNFRAGKQRDELQAGAREVAFLIEQARTYALAGKTVKLGGTMRVPPGGWGVSLFPQNDSSAFFADEGSHVYEKGSEPYEEEHPLADWNLVLDDCVDYGSGCLNESQLDTIFSAPLGTRFIQAGTANTGSATFTLRHSANPAGPGVAITMNAVSGQVSLRDVP